MENCHRADGSTGQKLTFSVQPTQLRADAAAIQLRYRPKGTVIKQHTGRKQYKKYHIQKQPRRSKIFHNAFQTQDQA